MQGPRHGRADAFRRCFGLPVSYMSIAERHARTFVTKQAGDHRQWYALQDGVAGERVTKVMQAHILDPGFLAHRVPKPQAGRQRPLGV